MTARARKSSAEGYSELCKPGDLFGRYEILFPIASGGMAIVYAARARGEGSFQKPVAVKLMLPHLTRDERFSSMFMDEATLAANIESPHVVGTLDLGRQGDVLYMAMDLVLGPTLRELQDAGRIPPPVAASILVQTARGLHDAHQARNVAGEPLRLVHRDVSPHNVLVGVDGRARLSDFGVARAIHRHSHTETGELKGKLAYFSPEQLEAREDLDHRSDVFALGVVAWETFAGERLFAAPNPLALAKLIANKEIPRLDAHAGLPTEVADAVARALEREPDARFSTAEELGVALERAARASFGMATATQVGALVRELGGERVQSLERRIQRLMTDGSPSGTFEITGPHPALQVSETTPVVSELALDGGTPRTRKSSSRWLAFAGLGAVAVASLVAMTLWLAGRDEGSTASTAPVDRVTPSAAPVDVPADPRPVEMAYEPQVPATGTPPSEVEPDSETADVERDLEDLAPTKRAPRRSRNQASSTASPMTTSNEQGGSEPSPEAGMTSETSSMTLSSSMAVLRVDLNRFEGSLRGPETTN
jgi:serine/threonine-protein kinase